MRCIVIEEDNPDHVKPTTMKIIFCLTMVSFIFFPVVNAQSIRFGMQAGATSSFMNSRYQQIREETDGTLKFGASAGVMADVKLGPNLSLSPALNFTQKGAIYRYENGVVVRGRRTLNYAEVLVNVLYGVPAANGRFSIGLGPSISYGLGGKYKEVVTPYDLSHKGSIKFGHNDEDDFKPLDYGGNVMTAYEFSNGFTLALNYYLGFSNLEINDFAGNKTTTSYVGFRIGYFLSRLPKK